MPAIDFNDTGTNNVVLNGDGSVSIITENGEIYRLDQTLTVAKKLELGTTDASPAQGGLSYDGSDLYAGSGGGIQNITDLITAAEARTAVEGNVNVEDLVTASTTSGEVPVAQGDGSLAMEAQSGGSGTDWRRYHREGTLEDGVTYTDEYIDGLEAATDEDIEIRNPFFNLVGSFDGVASDYQVTLEEVNGTGDYTYDGETFLRNDVVQLTASAPSSTGPALNIRLTKSQSGSQQVWFGFEWRRV